jgi:hypothetical protein
LACLEKQKNRVYYTGLRFSFFKILIKVRINERTVCLYWIKIKIGLKIQIKKRIGLKFSLRFKDLLFELTLGLRLILGLILGLRLIFGV